MAILSESKNKGNSYINCVAVCITAPSQQSKNYLKPEYIFPSSFEHLKLRGSQIDFLLPSCLQKRRQTFCCLEAFVIIQNRNSVLGSIHCSLQKHCMFFVKN